MKVKSKTGQVVAGVILLPIGILFTGYLWHLAINNGSVFRKMPFLAPVFIFAGLSLILFPVDYEKLREEQGIEEIQNWEQTPTSWKIMMVLAFVACGANGFAMWYMFP